MSSRASESHILTQTPLTVKTVVNCAFEALHCQGATLTVPFPSLVNTCRTASDTNITMATVVKKIACIGAGYVGGPTMAMIVSSALICLLQSDHVGFNFCSLQPIVQMQLPGAELPRD